MSQLLKRRRGRDYSPSGEGVMEWGRERIRVGGGGRRSFSPSVLTRASVLQWIFLSCAVRVCCMSLPSIPPLVVLSSRPSPSLLPLPPPSLYPPSPLFHPSFMVPSRSCRLPPPPPREASPKGFLRFFASDARAAPRSRREKHTNIESSSEEKSFRAEQKKIGEEEKRRGRGAIKPSRPVNP